tara:strand:- start:17272 stop:18228 length:957 start_codon:yes stop_codon:yes gene_type:complete
MKRAILHLGYPKTGTTFLQRQVLRKLDDKFSIITPEYNNLKLKRSKLKSQILSGFVSKEYKRQIDKKDLILSQEGIILESMRGFKDGIFSPSCFRTSLQGLRSLCDNFDPKNIEIILYIRRQDELMHSLYAESKTHFFDFSNDIHSLEDYIDSALKNFDKYGSTGYLYNYNNILFEIRKIFKDCLIHVRFYENLASSKIEQDFWSDLLGNKLDFPNKKENQRMLKDGSKEADAYSIQVPLVQFKNKFFPNLKFPNFMNSWLRENLRRIVLKEKISIYMTKLQKRTIVKRLSNPNKKFLENIGLSEDGARFGYFNKFEI